MGVLDHGHSRRTINMNVQKFLVNAANAGYGWDVNALSSLALQNGYRFSTAELQTAADELWGDLSEEQLRSVVGGGSDNGKDNSGNGKGGATHQNPPPGHGDGNTWAPPPGDVSGNSCFFIRAK